MPKTRNTKQKQLIDEQLKKFDKLFTAEELLAKVNVHDKAIGIATIYRFLNAKQKENAVHSYICDRKTMYSIRTEGHSHFICEHCEKTEHIDIKKIDFLKLHIKGKICHFQIDVHGVCADCDKKNKL